MKKGGYLFHQLGQSERQYHEIYHLMFLLQDYRYKVSTDWKER